MNPIVREITIGPCRLIQGDCASVMRAIPEVDAVVTDPPYGIGEAAGKNKSRGKLAISKDYGNDEWDNEPCSSDQIGLMRSVSKWQVIFGGNYFELPPSSCWLVWDKLNGNSDFADCELAWTNLKKAVRLKRFMWNGMLRDEKGERVHPTQKPIGVMEWCLSHIPDDVETILDPFMGSGTTGVACIRSDRQFIGIEKEAKYFDVAVKRIREAWQLKQSELPFEESPKLRQGNLLEVAG